MPDIDYHEQVAIKRNTRIRELLQELPQDCSDYFRSISQTTSALTRLAYAYDLRLFFQFLCSEQPDFAGIEPRLISTSQLASITSRQIYEFQDYLTQYIRSDEESETVVNNHELGIIRKLCCVRSFFEYLFKNERIPANVSTLVPLPKLHEKPILYLEPHEVEKMLSVADNGEGLSERQKSYLRSSRTRDKAILMLFLGTGIRVSELVGIDLDDVDFSINGFLVTRKGGNQTVLYFPETVADALLEYQRERLQVEALPGHENAFFLSLQRRRITQRAVENLVKKYALVAAPLKKKISPHKLRSTFGTSLYQSTGDIYLVADVLGHADVNTTRKHYAAMTDLHKREAAKKIQLPVKNDQNNSEENDNNE